MLPLSIDPARALASWSWRYPLRVEFDGFNIVGVGVIDVIEDSCWSLTSSTFGSAPSSWGGATKSGRHDEGGEGGARGA